MTPQEQSAQLDDCYKQLVELREKIHALQTGMAPQTVEDYSFKTPDGDIRLSELFGDKMDLFVVHNMGKSCVYCTLWADGLNGLLPHLEDRAAFVLSSPDEPAVQAEFAASRGWGFKMLSHKGSSFAEDMDYGSEAEGWLPGVSVFKKKNGKIQRVSHSPFGPGDDYCALWHLFSLIPEGNGDWQLKFEY